MKTSIRRSSQKLQFLMYQRSQSTRSLHQFEPSSLPAKAVDLSPTGEAGLHVLPKCILRNQLGISVVVGDSVRSRPDQ